MNTAKRPARILIATLAAGLLASLGVIRAAHATIECDPDTQLCKDPVLDTTDAELIWRYIGRLPLEMAGNTCPDANGWTASKMSAGAVGPLPKVLSRYCVYTANNPANPMPPAPFAVGLEQRDRDVMAAAPMGPLTPKLKNTIGPAVRAHFLAQAGLAGVAPTGNSNVRLAVLDTQPNSNTPMDDPEAVAGHGYALLHMAEDLACNENETNCAIHMSSDLALPWQCPDGPVCRDDVDGGYMGTPFDLADAITRELLKWQITGHNGLVINLSLGWDRVFNNRSDGTLRVATEAAITALQVASCRGAIVIAAAGNTIAGPERPDGPLMPAEFNRLAAPTRAECFALLPQENFPMSDFPPPGTDRPLLNAVGAVGADNQTFLARVDGEPELVAFGDHGIALDRAPELTDTLSGSSTSALVASAAIAQVWSYSPGLAAWEVMNAVYAAGTSVPTPDGLGVRTANFCLDSLPACGEVHRVTVCEAVSATCSGAGCPTAVDLNCQAPEHREPVIDRDQLAAPFLNTPNIDFGQPGFVTETIPGCSPRPGVEYKITYATGQRPDEPCPHIQYYGTQATPFAGGQPGQTNCEDCPVTFASPGTLYLEVAAAFQTEGAVLFCSPNNGTMEAYSLNGLGALTAPQRYTIEGIAESCAEVNLNLAAIPVGLPADDPATVVSPLLLSTDPDEDGVPAGIDNCLLVANSDQRDTDGDGIGNICDTDLNNNCVTNSVDLGLFKAEFFSADPDADFNGDGVVNVVDLGIVRLNFFMTPGPSADTTLCGP